MLLHHMFYVLIGLHIVLFAQLKLPVHMDLVRAIDLIDNSPVSALVMRAHGTRRPLFFASGYSAQREVADL